MVDRFLKYLQYEKRYSAHTLLAYSTDLKQFADFIKKDFEDVTENATYGMIRS